MTYNALAWHLTYNFYPAYDLRLIPYLQRAILKAKNGKWNDKITIRGNKVEVTTLIEDFRLEDTI